MVFPLKLPLDFKTEKYITLQLWDRDILKWNDFICESQINIAQYLRKAFRKKQTMRVFGTKNARASRLNAVKALPQKLEVSAAAFHPRRVSEARGAIVAVATSKWARWVCTRVKMMVIMMKIRTYSTSFSR